MQNAELAAARTRILADLQQTDSPCDLMPASDDGCASTAAASPGVRKAKRRRIAAAAPESDDADTAEVFDGRAKRAGVASKQRAQCSALESGDALLRDLEAARSEHGSGLARYRARLDAVDQDAIEQDMQARSHLETARAELGKLQQSIAAQQAERCALWLQQSQLCIATCRLGALK